MEEGWAQELSEVTKELVKEIYSLLCRLHGVVIATGVFHDIYEYFLESYKELLEISDIEEKYFKAVALLASIEEYFPVL